MHKEKNNAFALRKEGKGYKEISRLLGVPKSTLSEWFRGKPWSEEIKLKNIAISQPIGMSNILKALQVRKEKFQDYVIAARVAARREFEELKEDPLFIAGTMLYWGEGDNTHRSSATRLTNTNPALIRLFVRFLERACCVQKDKMRIELILYPDLDDLTCRRFWSNITSVPESQFYKTQHIKGRSQKRTSPSGICMVYVSDRVLKEKMLVWTNLVHEYLVEKSYAGMV